MKTGTAIKKNRQGIVFLGRKNYSINRKYKFSYKFSYKGEGICLIYGCKQKIENEENKKRLICHHCFHGADENRYNLAREARLYYEFIKKK